MTVSNDQLRMEALNRYWDAVVQGAGTPDDALDPRLIAEIQRVQGCTPPYAARIWRDVLAQAAEAVADPHRVDLDQVQSTVAGHARPPAADLLPVRARRRPGPRSLVGGVALLAALALGVIVPRLQPATPISAQVVLDRAAPRNAPPVNVAVHQIFLAGGTF